MTEESDLLRVALKQEMKMAIDQFREVYKKVSPGIQKIYTEANLTNELKVVEELGEYDIIFMLDVIEHIVDTEKVIRRLSKHGKKLYITTPNCAHWKVKIKHALGNFNDIVYPNRHIRFFDKNSLRNCVSKYFKNVNITKFQRLLVVEATLND